MSYVAGKGEVAGQAPDSALILLKARRTAASVHRILAFFYGAIALIPVVLLLSDPGARVGPLAGVIAIFAFLMALHIVAAYGALTGKRWGRYLSMVIGVLLIFGFPIGTLCGAILLVQTAKKEWRDAA